MLKRFSILFFTILFPFTELIKYVIVYYNMWFFFLATQLCLILCDPMDCSLPGSSVHGILQARVLEWVTIPFFRGSSWPKVWTWVYGSLDASYSVQFSLVAQLCPTLCNPMNRSTPGLPVSSPAHEVYSNSCPSSWWCHPAISSYVVPFSSCPQSLPASAL